MLLSIFISFLLARKFRGKVYILLMTVVLVLVSLFSIGFPSVLGTLKKGMILFPESQEGTIVWQMNLPAIPLSFPFHASINEGYPMQLLMTEYVIPTPYSYWPPLYRIKLCFLTIQIWANDNWRYLTSEHVILLVSSFLLINIVGALIGYWISKTTFIDKLLKKRQNISP